MIFTRSSAWSMTSTASASRPSPFTFCNAAPMWRASVNDFRAPATSPAVNASAQRGKYVAHPLCGCPVESCGRSLHRRHIAAIARPC